jgi:hypothetical protein
MVYYDQQNIVTPPKGTPGLSPLVMGPRRGSMHTKREAPPTPPSMGPSDIATPPSLTSTPIATAGSASPPKGEDWLLFNDFCVTPTTAAEARTLYGQHKTPCLLFFQRVDLPFPPPLPASQITEHMFRRLTPEPFSLKLVRCCGLCTLCVFRAASVERGMYADAGVLPLRHSRNRTHSGRWTCGTRRRTRECCWPSIASSYHTRLLRRRCMRTVLRCALQPHAIACRFPLAPSDLQPAAFCPGCSWSYARRHWGLPACLWCAETRDSARACA